MTVAPSGKSSQFDNFQKLIVAAFFFIFTLSKITLLGLKLVSFRSVKVQLTLVFWFIFVSLLILWNFAHLRLLYFLSSDIFNVKVIMSIASFGKWSNVWALYFLGVVLTLFMLGIREHFLRLRFQKAIEAVGVKNPNRESPKVQEVVHPQKKVQKTKIFVDL